jgi:hypothetical protein
MKKFILGLVILTTYATSAQNKIVFAYDAAGNQVKRELCISCPATTGKSIQEIEALKPEDLQQFFPEDVISFYPNPVKEQLYLQWELKDNNKVTSIQLYSLQGQLVKSFSKLDNTSNTIIDFMAYPQGIYNLVLVYANGEDKTIKIIK